MSAKKAGRTAGESDILATLKFDRPPIFFGTTTDPGCVKLVDKNKGFGANLPNFKEFDELATSMKATTIKDLDDWLVSMTSHLDSNDPAQRLIEIIATMGHGLCIKLLDTMATSYRSYHIVCRYSAKDSWLLVGRSTAIIFIHLKSIRARAMNLDDVRSARAKATVIWTMMQSLMALKQILDTGVQSHPVVMKEILEFQLEHRVDASQLKAVEDLVDTVKAQVKQCIASSAKADKATAALTEKITKITQEVGNLKTEIKKKEPKKG